MSQHLWATYPLCELPMYVAFHVFNCVLGAQGKRCANCDCSELVLGAEMVDWRESSTKNLDNCRKSMDTYLIVTANARTALTFFYQIYWKPDFEPYIVLRRDICPKYNEAFMARYYNKASHALELFAMRYDSHM